MDASPRTAVVFFSSYKLPETSHISVFETFTQRGQRRIGAGSPHANGSVNEATVCPLPDTVFQLFAQRGHHFNSVFVYGL